MSDGLEQRFGSIETALRQVAADHANLRGDHAALRGELNALRQLLEDARAAIGQTREGLAQIIVLQEKLLQQNEAQGRAFKQIGELAGRVTVLEAAAAVTARSAVPLIVAASAVAICAAVCPVVTSCCTRMPPM